MDSFNDRCMSHRLIAVKRTMLISLQVRSVKFLFIVMGVALYVHIQFRFVCVLRAISKAGIISRRSTTNGAFIEADAGTSGQSGSVICLAIYSYPVTDALYLSHRSIPAVGCCFWCGLSLNSPRKAGL